MLNFRKLIPICIGLLFVNSFSFAQDNNAQSTDNESGEVTGEVAGKVTGIGGWFIRSDDPAALSAWYEEHLGINRTPESYESEVWEQEHGPTIFAPFPNDTEYFGRPEQSWMINFRVNDLDALVMQLEAAGIEFMLDETEYPNGRFAQLFDPEGNPVQLWQPQGSN